MNEHFPRGGVGVRPPARCGVACQACWGMGRSSYALSCAPLLPLSGSGSKPARLRRAGAFCARLSGIRLACIDLRVVRSKLLLTFCQCRPLRPPAQTLEPQRALV